MEVGDAGADIAAHLAELFASWALSNTTSRRKCRIDPAHSPSSFRSGCQLPNSRQLRNYRSALRLLP